jgi:hypothetical protein
MPGYPYITPEELRAHVTTSLGDVPLGEMIASIADEIDDKYGPVGVDVSERLLSSRSSRLPLDMPRRPESMTSLVEEREREGKTSM